MPATPDHEPRQPFIRTTQWDPSGRSRNYCSACKRPVALRDRRWVHDGPAGAVLTDVLLPGDATFEEDRDAAQPA